MSTAKRNKAEVDRPTGGSARNSGGEKATRKDASRGAGARSTDDGSATAAPKKRTAKKANKSVASKAVSVRPASTTEGAKAEVKATGKASPKKKPATKSSATKKGVAKAASKSTAKDATKKKKKRKKAGEAEEAPPSSRRNFGLRGAAPWVARHAAKHAAELRARNAQPPPPGSARATLRVPVEAEQIKAKIAKLHQVSSEVRRLRKRLDKNFYEIGELLAGIQQEELYHSKGFSTFESFLDREIDLSRSVALRLIRICHTFHREMAYDYGIDRLTAALSALDGDYVAPPASQPSAFSATSFSSPSLPVKPPPFRYDDDR